MNDIYTNPIINLDSYNKSMQTTLSDKLFFIDKVNVDIYIDFGCADGSTLKAVQQFYPRAILFGYDINEEMIAKAKKNSDGIIYFSDLQKLKEILQQYAHLTKCLILNSVIHEVYSYSSQSEIKEFYQFIYSGLFDYIVIRDMMCDKYCNRLIDLTLYNNLHKYANSKQLSDFECIWGKISTVQQLIHYLLKYRYKENWKREVQENYLPISIEDFITLIPNQFCIEYCSRFYIPFIQDTIKKDFHIELQECTHVKFIISKIQYETI